MARCDSPIGSRLVPQPYPNYLNPCVTADAAAVATSRTTCFINGMRAIAEHSVAEASVSNILVAMLRADPGAAAAMYGVIRNGKLQRDAMLAAATERVSAPDRALLNDVLRLLDASARGRDKLAHSLWAVDPNFPNDAVLIDPSQIWRFSLRERVLNEAGGPSMEEAENMIASMRAALTIWTAQDCADVALRAVRATTGLIAYSQLLTATGPEQADEHRNTIRTLMQMHQGQSAS